MKTPQKILNRLALTFMLTTALTTCKDSEKMYDHVVVRGPNGFTLDTTVKHAREMEKAGGRNKRLIITHLGNHEPEKPLYAKNGFSWTLDPDYISASDYEAQLKAANEQNPELIISAEN